MHLYFSWLCGGNTYISHGLLNWLHELDSVFQKVLQPCNLCGLFLFLLSALKQVVASFGLVAISFAFTASKHGWDKVHPLAVLVSITILSIALRPGRPLAPFVVNGAGFLVAVFLILAASFALLTTIDCFLLNSPVPPFLPNTWAGMGVQGSLCGCHLRLFLVQMFTLHVHLVILFIQELVECLCQAGDVLVILMVQNVPDEVQLLALQGPTPSDLFNLGFDD